MKDEALINAVIEQILVDVGNHDMTAIEELLQAAPEEALQAYLSDIPQSQRWNIRSV